MQSDSAYEELERQYFGEAMHEKEEMAAFPGVLQDAQLFVDVGASLGPYSYAANNTLEGAEIICIEADPFRHRRLSQLAGEWSQKRPNKITVVHAAAGDRPGKIPFYATDKNISGGLFKHHVPDPQVRDAIQWSETEVDMITLDELLGERDPDLVKIDVEGAEYRVLLGARRLMERGKARFLVEVHPWGDEDLRKSPADVFNLFREYGYDFFRTHRHWLFVKKGGWIKRFVKNCGINIVMKSPGLKEFLKKLVLRMDRRKHSHSSPV